MLKMSPTWINACVDTSEHKLFHPFKGSRADANGFIGTKNASAKCFFILIGTEYTRVSTCPRWQKSEGLSSGECGGCTYESLKKKNEINDILRRRHFLLHQAVHLDHHLQYPATQMAMHKSSKMTWRTPSTVVWRDIDLSLCFRIPS